MTVEYEDFPTITQRHPSCGRELHSELTRKAVVEWPPVVMQNQTELPFRALESSVCLFAALDARNGRTSGSRACMK